METCGRCLKTLLDGLRDQSEIEDYNTSFIRHHGFEGLRSRRILPAA